HFGNGWPGTGGHPWARTGLVPGGVAAFCWACTLSVSSFWAHPGALAAFPAAELTWMALSLGGGCAWLACRTAPPGSPFRPGAIDVAGLAVMALALAVARQALRQARADAR